MKRRLKILFILVFLAKMVSAQDPSFFPVFASPLTLNPALTGKFQLVTCG
jgi:hypothetical protein